MCVGKRSRSKWTEKEGGEDHQHNACNSPRAEQSQQNRAETNVLSASVHKG